MNKLAQKLHPLLREFFNGESISIPAVMLPCDSSQWKYAREGFGYVDIGDGWTPDADEDYVKALVNLLNEWGGALVYNADGDNWCIEVSPEKTFEVDDAYGEICKEIFGV